MYTFFYRTSIFWLWSVVAEVFFRYLYADDERLYTDRGR